MASVLDNTRNISLYTLPVAWALSVAPKVYAVNLAAARFDNRHPRLIADKLENEQRIDEATKGKIIRAEGAQLNGLESLGFFAAAVVAANVAGVKTDTVNYLSVSYLVSRIVYNLLYINNDTIFAANTRSSVFFIGIGIICTLFVKSGNAINASKFKEL